MTRTKTIVRPKHGMEFKANGVGGCHTRWANPDPEHMWAGQCSGVQVAAWLNGLGEDYEPFGTGRTKVDGKIVTNGDVRRNWLRTDNHIEEDK